MSDTPSAAEHALAVYGSHQQLVWDRERDWPLAKPCPKYDGRQTSEPCTCGFDDAMAEVRREAREAAAPRTEVLRCVTCGENHTVVVGGPA